MVQLAPRLPERLLHPRSAGPGQALQYHSCCLFCILYFSLNILLCAKGPCRRWSPSGTSCRGYQGRETIPFPNWGPSVPLLSVQLPSVRFHSASPMEPAISSPPSPCSVLQAGGSRPCFTHASDFLLLFLGCEFFSLPFHASGLKLKGHFVEGPPRPHSVLILWACPSVYPEAHSSGRLGGGLL